MKVKQLLELLYDETNLINIGFDNIHNKSLKVKQINEAIANKEPWAIKLCKSEIGALNICEYADLWEPGCPCLEILIK